MGDVEAHQHLLVAVHHHEGQAGRGELLGHEAAHAAEAAHDEVAAQLLEASLHALSPEDRADLSRHHGADELRRRVEGREDPAQGQGHREDPPPGAHRVDLEEPDGRDRDGGHVEGVEPAPPLHELVAERARRQQREQDGDGEEEAGLGAADHRARSPAARAQAATVAGQGGRNTSRVGARRSRGARPPGPGCSHCDTASASAGGPLASLHDERGHRDGRPGERAPRAPSAGARTAPPPRPRATGRGRMPRPRPARPRAPGPASRRDRGRPTTSGRGPQREAPRSRAGARRRAPRGRSARRSRPGRAAPR